MTERRHRGSPWLAVALAGAALASATCSSSGGSGAAENALIGVQTSPLWITVENKAGMALTDIVIEVIPVGSQVAYSTRHWRLESGEKRDFASNSLRARDNTPFNIRVSRPKAVKVSGKDVAGKVVQVEVPWR